MNPLDRFEFHCPQCDARISARNRARGRTRQCPGCQCPITVPDQIEQQIPLDIDLDAQRSLEFLAARAAKLVQELLEKDRKAAIVVNGIFLYLPEKHLLEVLPTELRPYADAAWKICDDVKRTLARYGSQHREQWVASLERMHVVYQDETVRPRVSRRKWSIKVRRQIWMRYGRKCYHCGLPLETWQGQYMHLDHLDPLVGSGDDDIANLVPACPDCNLEKGGVVFPELAKRPPRSSDAQDS